MNHVAMGSMVTFTHLGPCRWARAGIESRHSSGAQKRIGSISRRGYNHGVCPCEVPKVESGARADSDPPGGLSFLERRSAAYLRGFDAGRRGRDIGACQYEGHNDASLALQRLWMAGHFDAVTGAMRPRRLRPAHITHRKAVRVRWPKSSYARHRLQLIISHSLI